MAWERREPEKLERRSRIERDGTVPAFSGKIEFGQGIRTAFAQLVADELDVPIERVQVVLGDTDQVPFDFGTFGSHSVAQEAPLLRKAAAFARRQLIDRASAKLGLSEDKLDTAAGAVVGGGKSVSYGELLDSEPLAGVVPDRDEQARAAAAAVEADWHALPVEGPTAEVTMRSDPEVDAGLRGAAMRLTQTYVLPPIANAPIGPSAAVADVRSAGATMYVGTHRPFGVREQIAKTVGLPEKKVRVLPQITSGTYGRNSHADAAIEAAILSKGAGRPVR